MAEHVWTSDNDLKLFGKMCFPQPGLFGTGINIWQAKADRWQSVGTTVQGYPRGARFAVVHLAGCMTDPLYAGNAGPKLAAPELSFADLPSPAVPVLSIPSNAVKKWESGR